MSAVGGRFEVGSSPPRLEDARFLAGEGRYLDDLDASTALHAVVLRSPHAHARIRNVSSEAATAMPGVALVLTGQAVARAGLLPTWPHGRVNVQTGEPFPYEGQPLLADQRVRYVGEPVALIVADSSSRAADAAQAVEIDYEPLPAVVQATEALRAGAPQLTDAVPGNTCLDWCFGDKVATDAALSRAAHVASISVHNHRVAHNAMEPRGAFARYDEATGIYRLELSTQNVHVIRDHIARSMGVAASKVRVIAPDVGGGFGVRNFVYAEYILLAWAAKQTGRSVKWVATRSEGFLSDHQARDYTATARLGLDAAGRFTALAVASDFALGAYVIGAGAGVPTGQYCTCPGSVYQIPSVHLGIRAGLTNTVPIGVTRGPGFAEMVDLMERLVDVAAAEIGIDRVELRRRNLVSASAMPWTNAVGTIIDSGDFPGCLDQAVAVAGYDSFPARRAKAAARGRLRGLGIASHIKATGGLDEENVTLAFDAGELVLVTGTQAIGQGHETTFRQIACTLLGVPFDKIRYVAGDSQAIAMGGGHGSSRATYMASTAMAMATERLLAKARPVAGALLEADPDDLEFADGAFRIVGTDRGVPLLDVAEQAARDGCPLDTYQHFRRDAMTYPSGCHVAEVEVDPETGVVRLVEYTVVDDYGTLVNPTVARGQVHGAIAQGVGQALLEQVVLDENGQLLTGSFMDYAMPRADDLPSFSVRFNATRCTTNPLGVKGCGEAGAIAGYPAVANAIRDALGDPRLSLVGAARPETVWRLLAERNPR